MELQISPIKSEQITWNYQELKTEIVNRVEMYKHIVYTEDQIKEARKDRAALNKLAIALDDAKKDVKNQLFGPYSLFESQIEDLIKTIKEPVALIDNQVKEFEEKKKAEKLDAIRSAFAEMEVPEGMKFEFAFMDKMLNASYSMSLIKQNLQTAIETFEYNVKMLSALPDVGEDAVLLYKQTGDSRKALEEANRIKALNERKKLDNELKNKADNLPKESVQKPVEVSSAVAEDAEWINFSAKLTVSNAIKLREFFLANNIEFKSI